MNNVKKICGLIVWLALNLSAGSETYYVATNGVDDRTGAGDWTNAIATISNGVAKASDGDIVLVSNGTYVLTAEIIVVNGIAVRSFNGYTNTIVDGNYPSYSNRCFSLIHANAVLDGFTIMNGCAIGGYGGGGVYLALGSLLTNCLITGNRAITNVTMDVGGGGIACDNSSDRIYNCRIINNSCESTTYRGGGGVRRGSLFNCEVISNRSERHGGGIYIDAGDTVMISNCLVAYNRATNSGTGGGGIFIDAYAQVIDCTIAMNIVGNSGGGIGFFAASGVATMLNCNVYGNTGLIYAGGIVAWDNAYTLIDRCVVSNNWGGAGAGGGGIYLRNNGLVRNCLIVSNTTARDLGGGGIYAYEIGNRGGAIQSCTIAGNTAPSAGGISLNSTNNFVVNTIIWSNTATGGSYPDVYNTTEEQSNSYAYCCTPTAFTNTANRNITNHPRFFDIASGNYRLSRGSPCVNTGTNAAWMTGAVDLDGHRRVDKFGGIVDMGCYEYLLSGTMFSIP